MTQYSGINQAEARVQLSPLKIFFFSSITIVGFFLVLEGLLFFKGYKPYLSSDPYVGFQSKFPLFSLDKGKSGNKVYKTTENKLASFNKQSFPAKKADNTFRIFTLGGSTTYGRPYFDSTSFTGWFREFIRVADPKRNWEVINCGGVSYASYRVAALMEELIQYEPDLFIVYSGHNEFLERRTYSGIIEEPVAVTRLKLLLGNFRTYSLISDIQENLLSKSKKKEGNAFRLADEVDAILDNSAGLDIYSRDDELKRKILDHFRFNLNRMVELAKSRNAGIIFVTTPVNAKDFSPFKSQHKDGLDWKNFDGYEKELAKASLEIEEKHYDSATDKLKKLIKEDGRYALTHYELGRALFGLGRFDDAKKEFMNAIDEDIGPLRKLSQMDRIFDEVASKNNVPLVNFTETLESHSFKEYGHNILGKEYFLDHVHPTISANRLLGLELLNAVIDMGIAKPQASWGEAKINEIVKKVEGGIDEKAHAHANKILARVLIWSGKKKEAARFAESAIAVLHGDAEAQFHWAFSMDQEGKYEEAITGYKQAIELFPNYIVAYKNLSFLMYRTGRKSEALDIIRNAAKKFPDNPKIHNYHGRILYSEKLFEKAARSYKRSLELDPNNAFVHNNLGQAYYALSMDSEAIESFRASLKLDPNYLEAKKYLGFAHTMAGRYGEALLHLEEALKADPSDKQVIEYIGYSKQEIKKQNK